ncbi:Uncharacterized protein TCM_033653 [Theobroma cacao]|uniref:Uncharacterized protein n=1 Tax=Theobroma cacao TaxID=3641 RepID=A0A061FBM5_THECC|nr:Uncharacterized protein TCM_033653 [Theobroma cacao]
MDCLKLNVVRVLSANVVIESAPNELEVVFENPIIPVEPSFFLAALLVLSSRDPCNDPSLVATDVQDF